MRITLMVIALVCLVWSHNTATMTKPQNDEDGMIVFEKQVSGAGQRIVIRRGPDRDPQQLLAFWNAPHSTEVAIDNIYELRVVLDTPNEPPLLLGAIVTSEFLGSGKDRGATVLDVLIERGVITVMMAEGYHLRLWQIGAFRGFGRSIPFANDWMTGAALYLVNKENVTVTISRAPDGRLGVDVLEKQRKYTTHYLESEPNSLHFIATNPPKGREADKGPSLIDRK